MPSRKFRWDIPLTLSKIALPSFTRDGLLWGSHMPQKLRGQSWVGSARNCVEIKRKWNRLIITTSRKGSSAFLMQTRNHCFGVKLWHPGVAPMPLCKTDDFATQPQVSWLFRRHQCFLAFLLYSVRASWIIWNVNLICLTELGYIPSDPFWHVSCVRRDRCDPLQCWDTCALDTILTGKSWTCNVLWFITVNPLAELALWYWQVFL